MNIVSIFYKAPIFLKLWSLYLICVPFYLFRSGLPQPSDFILIMLILFSWRLKSKQKIYREKYILKPLHFLISYITIVAIVWWFFLKLPDSQSKIIFQFTYPLFYLYNLLSIHIVFTLYKRYGEKFLRISLSAFFISVMLQILLLPFILTTGFRDPLFFNNPNQLGYYVLLCSVIFLYLDTKLKSPIWQKVLFFLGATILSSVSTSKSALISLILLICINLLDAGILKVKQLFGAIFALSLVTIFMLNTDFGILLTETVVERFEDIGEQNDDSAEGRGYDRIWRFPEYLILGAGEGGVYRFYEDVEFEMHSSFGTLFFSYGIPGIFMFCFFVYRVYNRQSLTHFLYALPVFAYGLTHMGLRFTLFWIFFAIVIVVNDWERKKKIHGFI